MVFDIAKFELHRHLKKPSTYIYFAGYFVLMLFWTLMVGGAFEWASVSFDNSKLLANGSFSVTNTLTTMGAFGMISVAAFMGQAVYQDFHHRMHPLIFVRPITKAQYLLGRFFGTYALMVLVFLSLPLAAWLATLMGMIPAKALGPNSFSLYMVPYFSMVMVNMLWGGAVFFALAAVLRKMMPVYIGSLVLLVAWLASSATVNDINSKEMSAMLDPFGMGALEDVGEYWTVHEKNTEMVGLGGMVLLNRLLWLVVGAVVLTWCYIKFEFVETLENKKLKKEQTSAPVSMRAEVKSSYGKQLFDAVSARMAFFSLVRFEMWQTLKNRYFAVLLFAAIIFVVFASANLGTMFGTQTYPTTYMVTGILGGGFQFFVVIVLIFYAGELVWREKDAGIKHMVDALPVPPHYAYFAKLAALMSVIGLMLSVILIAGVLIQAANGYYAFDFHVYFTELYGINFVRAFLLAVLAIFVQVVVGNKYAGHGVMIVIYLVTFAMPQMGIETSLLQYGRAPGVLYSDMNGYGTFLAPHAWFRAYWLLFALVLMQLTILLWPRGEVEPLKVRFKLARWSFNGRTRQLFSVNVAAFALMAVYLGYNTLVLNPVESDDERLARQVQYEKDYRQQYEWLKQPSIVDAQFNVDIFAQQRQLQLAGRYQMENLQDEPLGSLFINLPADLTLVQMELSRANKLAIDDSVNRVKVFEFDEPLAPGEKFTFNYRLSFTPKGISEQRKASRIFQNGTFLDVDYFPSIGFSEGRTLRSDRLREKYGLGTAPELPEADDIKGQMRSAFSGETHWVTSHFTVSTDLGQIALAPGNLNRQWTEGERAYFEYKAPRTTVFFPAVVSAQYAVVKAKWNDVDIEVYHHPRHTYNLDIMIKGVQESLEVFTQSFGEYPFDHVRIVEFPRFSMFAQSYPGIIPYSEAIGFIAKVDNSKDTVVDYPFYVTAHEMAHQWWPHQTSVSTTKGANMLSEALAQYSALVVMESHHGTAKMREFLRHSLDRYLSGRGSEKDEEVPLMRADEHDYVYYDKGGIALYALRDYVGAQTLDGILKAYLEEYKYASPDKPYPTSDGLVKRIRDSIPKQYDYLVTDLFEEITLMDMRTQIVEVNAKENGQYELTLKGQMGKKHFTGTGIGTSVAMNDFVDVVVFDEARNPLYQQKHQFTEGEFELKVTVDQKPAWAGVDPYHKLIDRRPDDNIAPVKF